MLEAVAPSSAAPIGSRIMSRISVSPRVTRSALSGRHEDPSLPWTACIVDDGKRDLGALPGHHWPRVEHVVEDALEIGGRRALDREGATRRVALGRRDLDVAVLRAQRGADAV